MGLSWRRYRDFPPLENGSLFTVPNLDDVKVESRNREAIKHGLEPIDPSTRRAGENRDGTPRFVPNDPRVKHVGLRPGVGTIEKAEE